MERTLWYSIDYKKLEEIYSNLNSEEEENSLGQNYPMDRDNLTQPIPKTYMEIPTETLSSSSLIQKNDSEDGDVCDTDFYNSEYQEVIECP